MKPLDEQDIRSSFINCSKGEIKRLPIPKDLGAQPWDDLDFLGWSDPSFAGRCYLVFPLTADRPPAFPHDDELVGVALRYETGGTRKAQMCSVCLTTHPSGGVALMTARKTGESGRKGNTVGTYMCADLDCSLYTRRKKTPALGRQFREDFDPDERIAKLQDNLAAFVARVRS